MTSSKIRNAIFKNKSEGEGFCFPSREFLIFKLNEKEVKPYKRNFKRGLAMAFNVKNS